MRAPSLLVSALVALASAMVASPAGAHSETGVLSLDLVARPGSTVEVQVALSYTDDGHPAEDALVTASATGPGGATAGPVTLTPIGLGGYRGELQATAAGTWIVRAESADPTATAETTVEIVASGTPDTPDPDDTAPADEPDAGGGDVEGDDDGSSDVVPWVVAGVAVALIVGGGAMLLRRRRG
jgi:hypothetical protein